jgi:hypothetical protein
MSDTIKRNSFSKKASSLAVLRPVIIKKERMNSTVEENSDLGDTGLVTLNMRKLIFDDDA